jgi:subtilase family serine protease
VHNAQFPATDPWATAVGGTSAAIGANGGIVADYPWGDNLDTIDAAGIGYTQALPGTYSVGSGGGISSLYSEPGYQRAVVPGMLATDGGTTAPSRVIPDISADAGLSWLVGWTGAVTDGAYAELPAAGGTSASTPLIAGLEADAIQAAGHPLGFINPALYSLSGSAAISDILPVNPAGPPILDGNQTDFGGVDPTQLTTLGEDVGLTATPGYDDVTGLGAPTNCFVTALAEY